MKSLKEQNPIVLIFAIIGVCALLYGGWTLYQRHLMEEQTREFFQGPPSPGTAGLYKPSEKPPPQ